MEHILDMLKRYRYGILILMIGISLMLLPTPERNAREISVIDKEETSSVSDSLEEILSQIDGVGRVVVMLTQSAGEITIYQQNRDQSNDTLREDTVIISGASRDEQGLVRQVIPPKFQGAVIVCQGGDRAVVRLAVVEAVSALTGLSSDKITVLKMK